MDEADHEPQQRHGVRGPRHGHDRVGHRREVARQDDQPSAVTADTSDTTPVRRRNEAETTALTVPTP